jgi:N-acetyl sugar amidotransferase
MPSKNVISRYGLPETVHYCTKCVISNQRPRITFDADGVCSACRYAERKHREFDWKKREEELLRLLDKHRGTGRPWDVVVPGSGGKDSAFVAHQLKYVYGMTPLTVTFTPAVYTEVGRQNYQRFVDSGFDNIFCNPNGQTHRKLTRLGFEHVGDPFQPFVYGVKNFAIQTAVQYGIPLVMYGENGEVEYGGDAKNENSPTHDLAGDLERHYFSGVGPLKWVGHLGLTEADLRIYMPPPLEEIRKVGVQAHFYGYYRKWLPQENYYYAVENTGFQANPDGRSEGTYSKYASLDDQLDGFHFYMAYIKFGIGRATSDAAHEIRDGHLTREEGVALVRRYDGEFPEKYFRVFLDYTGLTEQEFHAVVDSYRSPHLWEKADGVWKLQCQVS